MLSSAPLFLPNLRAHQPYMAATYLKVALTRHPCRILVVPPPIRVPPPSIVDPESLPSTPDANAIAMADYRLLNELLDLTMLKTAEAGARKTHKDTDNSVTV
jgi:hypothetical protein